MVYGAAAGVCNATLGVAANCQEMRGGVYDITKSSTWRNELQRPLDLNAQLGRVGVGQYGFDTVGLGYSNSSGTTLQNQIVAAIVSNDYWFGSLGLGFQPTNFTGYDDPQPSFTETLFNQGRISSRSWSYTAGANYRLKSVFGSLVFGGYDESRFTHNNVTFNMAGDNLRDLIVTIRSISTGGTTISDTPEFAYIDSSVPELWLPPAVCDAFAREFSLQLDEDSGYYLVNESMHSALSERQPEIIITLADQKEGDVNETVEIVLPYGAFDLNISAPLLPNETSYYFPIRRATGSQYVLGRTFLQEAYVTAHYGDRVFNVSQCVFEERLRSRIIALPERLPTYSNEDGGDVNAPDDSGSGTSSKKLNAGAIAGIVIGVLAAVTLLALLVFCVRRRKRRSTKHPDAVEIDPGRRIEPPDENRKWVSEHGEQASSFTNEVEGRERFELDGQPFMRPAELAGTAVSPSALEKNHHTSPLDTTRISSSDEKDFAGDEVEGRSPTSFTGSEREERLDVVGRGMEPGRTLNTKPSLTVSSPGSTIPDGEGTTGWTPTTPVHRSGTAGSRFREGF